jgi:hypothetical protein
MTTWLLCNNLAVCVTALPIDTISYDENTNEINRQNGVQKLVQVLLL